MVKFALKLWELTLELWELTLELYYSAKDHEASPSPSSLKLTLELKIINQEQ